MLCCAATQHSCHLHLDQSLHYAVQVEEQILEYERFQHQLPALQSATIKLESIVGSSNLQQDFPQELPNQMPRSQHLSAESLSGRLEAAAESASLLAAELQSVHRQHVTAGLLLQQEQTKAQQLEADLTQAKVPPSQTLTTCM